MTLFKDMNHIICFIFMINDDQKIEGQNLRLIKFLAKIGIVKILL